MKNINKRPKQRVHGQHELSRRRVFVYDVYAIMAPRAGAVRTKCRNEKNFMNVQKECFGSKFLY